MYCTLLRSVGFWSQMWETRVRPILPLHQLYKRHHRCLVALDVVPLEACTALDTAAGLTVALIVSFKKQLTLGRAFFQETVNSWTSLGAAMVPSAESLNGFNALRIEPKMLSRYKFKQSTQSAESSDWKSYRYVIMAVLAWLRVSKTNFFSSLGYTA